MPNDSRYQSASVETIYVRIEGNQVAEVSRCHIIRHPDKPLVCTNWDHPAEPVNIPSPPPFENGSCYGMVTKTDLYLRQTHEFWIVYSPQVWQAIMAWNNAAQAMQDSFREQLTSISTGRTFPNTVRLMEIAGVAYHEYLRIDQALRDYAI